jgi:hypothetical protein
MSLFVEHEAKQRRLDELAGQLLKASSFLGLHAWYRSEGGVDDPTLLAAASDAESAARILLGEARE